MIARELRRFGLTLRDGMALVLWAPPIFALAAVPEMLQHVAEIRLGMFESREAFMALAFDETRFRWAIPKVLGVTLAIFYAIRVWPAREAGIAWWSNKGIDWSGQTVATVLSLLVLAPGVLAYRAYGVEAAIAITAVLVLTTLPLLTYFTGTLAPSARVTLREAFRTGWAAAVRMLVGILVVFVPIQAVHAWNHTLAFGQVPALVWALMAWDSVLIGVLALLIGTVTHHACLPQTHFKEPAHA